MRFTRQDCHLSHRMDPELDGDCGAVRLDGALGDAQKPGNLFVSVSAHHECEHGTLAFGQRRKSTLTLLQQRTRGVRFGIPLESADNGRQQLLLGREFLEKVHSSAAHCLYAAWDISVPGKEDYWHHHAPLRKKRLQFQA